MTTVKKLIEIISIYSVLVLVLVAVTVLKMFYNKLFLAILRYLYLVLISKYVEYLLKVLLEN